MKKVKLLGAVLICTFSIGMVSACSLETTQKEEETTKKEKVTEITTVKETEKVTEKETMFSMDTYQAKGEKMAVREELSFIDKRLNGKTVRNGETIYVNELVGDLEAGELTDLYRGALSQNLLAKMGIDQTSFLEKYNSNNDVAMVPFEDNYSITNDTGKNFYFEFVGIDPSTKWHVYDIYTK